MSPAHYFLQCLGHLSQICTPSPSFSPSLSPSLTHTITCTLSGTLSIYLSIYIYICTYIYTYMYVDIFFFNFPFSISLLISILPHAYTHTHTHTHILSSSFPLSLIPPSQSSQPINRWEYLANKNDEFWFRTNSDAPRFRIVRSKVSISHHRAGSNQKAHKDDRDIVRDKDKEKENGAECIQEKNNLSGK